MKLRPEDFQSVAREEVAKTAQRDFVIMVAGVFNYLCDTAMGAYGDKEEQDKARALGAQIRENTLHNLPQLLEEFEKNATSNGIQVLWAADAEEACQLVKGLVEKHQVKTITKGKSMISEEIGLNHFLEQETGVKIYEGDLGEFIVQQRGTLPFHIVGPAINLTVQEIASILQEHIDMPYTETAAEIVSYVRTFLRDKFERADMGITGVNQAIASTGSLILVENEGNIRWVTSAPRVHVALMSIEKVCASFADAFHLLGLLTRNCTGQAITSYVSILNGPRRDDEEDGPEAMYVVIVDNGRSAAYQDPHLKEALRCIRCGRCGIQCPIYGRVGAYPYGWCYPGPMGNVIAPLIMGLDRTRDLYEACTLCGGCQSVCPGGTPHLDLISRYRHMKVTGDERFGGTRVSLKERAAFELMNRGMQNPALYKSGLKIARSYINRRSQDGYISSLPGPMSGWFTCRDFPQLPEKSFRERWQEDLQREAAQLAGSAAAQQEAAAHNYHLKHRPR
ncbi:MAG TPA: lactate utilization protein B [Syntrophomonadaceae bacterium]|nr:lactate utilization protein [Syntrophomonadaceae bacterium]HOQ09723.1 lactate utilization protein B [Syntrophomonadaceae bacterium]HPU48490.1 lactate utilization protein B [Syntrophomonadaceae bacterium]